MGYLGDCRKVIASAQSTVQVYHMDPARTLLDKALGDRDGVIPINGLPRRLALTQANDAAGSNIDGREEIHYRRATATTALGNPPSDRRAPAPMELPAGATREGGPVPARTQLVERPRPESRSPA